MCGKREFRLSPRGAGRGPGRDLPGGNTKLPHWQVGDLPHKELMNLAIIGYGKMGKLIEQLAPPHTIGLKLDEFNNSNYEGITAENFRGIGVAIDFSIPSAVVENVRRISGLGVNIVLGTTGWLDQLDKVKTLVEKNNIGLVWSPNYSIG